MLDPRVLAFLVAFVVSAAILVFARSRAGAAIAAGMLAGHLLLEGLPTFTPLHVKESVFCAAAIALVVSFVPSKGRAVSRFVAAAAIVALILARSFDVATAACATVLLFALTVGHEAVASEQRGPVLPALWCAAAAGSAFALFKAGSASLALLAGVLGVATAPALLLSIRPKGPALTGGGAAVLSLILGALLLGGRTFAELSPLLAAVLLAAPLVAAAFPRGATES